MKKQYKRLLFCLEVLKSIICLAAIMAITSWTCTAIFIICKSDITEAFTSAVLCTMMAFVTSALSLSVQKTLIQIKRTETMKEIITAIITEKTSI